MSGYRPVKVSCWEKFLAYQGCKYKSTEASHHKWTCPGCNRSIVFQGAEKEIPVFHIRQNLKSMNLNMKDAYLWFANNC